MNGSKKAGLFLIVLLAMNLITHVFPRSMADGYGEDSTSLGQFVDDYENDDNVSVAVNVINNQTLDCMELNSTLQDTVVYNLTSLREHDRYGEAQNVNVIFSINNNDELRMVDAGLGRAYIFLVINSEWLDGKYLRYRYYPYSSIVNVIYQSHRLQVQDGTFDRSNDADFPDGELPPAKGNGQLYEYVNADGLNAWFVKDFQIDTSGGSQTNVTVWWVNLDAWVGISIGYYLDWIEINEGAGGTDNILTINFNDSSPITMEKEETEDDYGFSLNSELPFYIGGFKEDGYFTTTELLSEIKGNSLVLMTNSTLNNGDLEVQFSTDNSTWVDHNNQAGYDELSGGFESLDLRDINSTTIYLRYNFTRGEPEKTPRLYQSRLITTEGNGVDDFVCDIRRFNATSINVIAGTLNDGNLASTYLVDDDWYNVTEVNEVPGLDVRFNFTDIPDNVSCGCIEVDEIFIGSAQHDISIEVWNFTSVSWHEIGVILYNETLDWDCPSLGPDPSHYFNDGKLFARFYHSIRGHPPHELCIEEIDLVVVLGEPGPPCDEVPPVDDYSIIFLAIGLILMLAIYFLYSKLK